MNVYYRDVFDKVLVQGLRPMNAPLHMWEVDTQDHCQAIQLVRNDLKEANTMFKEPILAVIVGGANAK